MIASLILSLALGAGQVESDVDQTSDALIVSKFLAAVRYETDDDPRSLLTPTVALTDYAQRERRSLEEFARYSQGCRLKKIELVNVRDLLPMPVSVMWQCRYPQPDRHASFWLEGDQISRVSWGAPLRVPYNGPTFAVPPTPATSENRR